MNFLILGRPTHYLWDSSILIGPNDVRGHFFLQLLNFKNQNLFHFRFLL
jgi:hypothetical protein